MNEYYLEPLFTRTATLRLAAVGVAGFALGTRPARADRRRRRTRPRRAPSWPRSRRPTATEHLSRSEAPSAPAALDRYLLSPAERPPASRRVSRAAQARARFAREQAGYRKALDIMALQGVLQRMDTGFSDPFDADLYFVSVFGTPGDRAWGWRLEGTTSPGTSPSSATRSSPSRSSSARGRRAPGAHIARSQGLPDDGARGGRRSGDRALARPRAPEAGRVLVESLTDHLTQNAVRVKPLERVGMLTGDLPSAAQRRVGEIIRTYLANHPPAMAKGARARRASGHRSHPLRLGRQHSTRRVPLLPARTDLPPRVRQLRNSGTVWRDFERDFGSHLLWRRRAVGGLRESVALGRTFGQDNRPSGA